MERDFETVRRAIRCISPAQTRPPGEAPWGADEGDALRALERIEARMVECQAMLNTCHLDEHPDGYEGPCWCAMCRSYADWVEGADNAEHERR
jgi:hypothetical protein